VYSVLSDGTIPAGTTVYEGVIGPQGGITWGELPGGRAETVADRMSPDHRKLADRQRSGSLLDRSLRPLIQLLEEAGEHTLAEGLKAVQTRLQHVSPAAERQTVIRELLAFFRGSGSLSDLVLMREGRVLRTENDRLDELRHEVFRLAQDELSS
jgi:hypothetical protein